MNSHYLKTDSDVWEAVNAGIKTFEIRKNDRDFQVGDMLFLQKTKHTGEQMAQGFPLQYLGLPIKARVIYIMRGPMYGLAEGWVIMSIQLEPLEAGESNQWMHNLEAKSG